MSLFANCVPSEEVSTAFMHLGPDEEQLDHAAEGRVLLTFNVGDFARLHHARLASGGAHAGIVVSAQRPIGDRDLVVKFQKRAHSPYLVAAGFHQIDLPIPWLGGRRLQFQFA